MRAVTVRQPYAELLARGATAKPVENRTRRTAYRGPLLIHAGKSRAWMRPGDDERYPDLAWGAFIAVATLDDCVQLADLPSELRDHPETHGPWCLVIEDVVRIVPIPFRGTLGVWGVPPDIVARIEVAR